METSRLGRLAVPPQSLRATLLLRPRQALRGHTLSTFPIVAYARRKPSRGSVHRSSDCLSYGAWYGCSGRRILGVDNPSITQWKQLGKAVDSSGGFCAQVASLPHSKKLIQILVESSEQLGTGCRVIHREDATTNTEKAALSSDKTTTCELHTSRYPRKAPVLIKTKNFNSLLEETPVFSFRSLEETVGT